MEAYNPRPYQAEDLDRIEDAYRSGDNRILYHAATGLGKGVTASFLPRRFPRLMEEGMLVLVPRREIAFQMRDNFRRQVPSAKVGIEMAERRADGDEDVLIVSSHTLGRRDSDRIEKMMRSFGILVNDESHHTYRGGIVDNVLSWFGQGSNLNVSLPSGTDPLVVHMTATPEREDEHSIAPFCDYALPSRGIRFGVDSGWLVPIDAHQVTEQAQGDVQDMDGYEADLLVRAYEEFGLGKKLIVFAQSVDVAKLAERRFEERGVGAGFISGSECRLHGDEARRKDVIEAHKAGDIRVVTNFGVLVEGYDDETLGGLLMGRSLSSERLYTQIMGRALRPLADVDACSSASERRAAIAESTKPAAHIVDIGGSTSELEMQVTAPTVLGIEPEVVDDIGGEEDLVLDVVDTIDEIDEEQPERDLRDADPSDIKLAARGVDVWSQTVYNDRLKTFSSLRWVKWGEPPRYALYVPVPPSEEKLHRIDNRDTIIYIRPDGEEGEAFDVIEIDTGGGVKTRRGWRGTRADASQLTTIRREEVAGYMERVEAKLRETDGEAHDELAAGDATRPATDDQIEALEEAGYAIDREEVTERTASLLLDFDGVAEKIDAIASGEQGTNDAQKILS